MAGGFEQAVSVALLIGIAVTGWCCWTIVSLLQRVSVLETKQAKCHCDVEHEDKE